MVETFDSLTENGIIIYIKITVQKEEKKRLICNVPCTLELRRVFSKEKK